MNLFPSCFRKDRAPPVSKTNPSSAKDVPATSSTAAPDVSPVQADIAPERTTAKASPTPSSRGKDAPDDNLNQQVKNPPQARSSLLLEGIALSDIDQSTLASYFQVGRHVSRFLFVCSVFRRVRDQRSR